MSNKITAFIQTSEPFPHHPDSLAGYPEGHTLSDPVKVTSIDFTGATLEEPLPEGRVVIYSVLEETEVPRTRYDSLGYKPVATEDGEIWVQAYEKKDFTEKVTAPVSYAVTVTLPSELSEEVEEPGISEEVEVE